MFNLQGSEIIVILLLALVVLGPEKLPDAVRKFSRTYAELKKMGSGFQTELKSALDEPMREMRETAHVVRDAADPSRVAAEAEAEKRLRDDAANAQVHHLAPFTASADLPGATPADPDDETVDDDQPADRHREDRLDGDRHHEDRLDGDRHDEDRLDGDRPDLDRRDAADVDDLDDGEARTA